MPVRLYAFDERLSMSKRQRVSARSRAPAPFEFLFAPGTNKSAAGKSGLLSSTQTLCEIASRHFAYEARTSNGSQPLVDRHRNRPGVGYLPGCSISSTLPRRCWWIMLLTFIIRDCSRRPAGKTVSAAWQGANDEVSSHPVSPVIPSAFSRTAGELDRMTGSTR